MRSKLIPVLSLATLLLACAHDKANQEATNSADGDGARAEREADGERSAGAEVGDEPRVADKDKDRTEPVAVPRRRTDGDRLASANGEVPIDGREPDNSGVNKTDREKGAMTAMDQGNGEIDLDLTQRIRKAVIADDSLSFTAKNAKIITRDGHVTLRGPVKSAAEKETLYKAAVSAAGVGHVTNELAVDAD